MNFDLAPETKEIVAQLSKWNDSDRQNLGLPDFSTRDWANFLSFDILEPVSDDTGTMQFAAIISESGRKSLPGPVLEAYLALRSGSTEAAEALRQGKVVTSVPPSRKKGGQIVPWGAVADLVVEQETGRTLARAPLRAVKMAYPLHAGWLDRDASGNAAKINGDSGDAPKMDLSAVRWALSGATLAGLGRAAVAMTKDYALTRIAFERPIAAQQSLQHRLVESHVFIEAAALGSLDAAWRISSGDSSARVAGALAWLWSARAGERVRRHCHQVFGALGFCYETGLVKLTWQMDLLRLEMGRKAAIAEINSNRDLSGSDPAVNVLAGYRRAA